MNYKPNKIITKKAGFVSLIALLLANVFLLIGMSIFAISIKELNLSFGGRESLFAFYAADGGMECALYWDIREDAFSVTAPPRLDEITCNNINNIEVNYDSENKESNFEFSLGTDETFPCVEVTVTKIEGEILTTRIISRGRNSCDTNNPRRVERAWRVHYQ